MRFAWGFEGTSVNVWGLVPRLSCDEAQRYASRRAKRRIS